jgi:hypothetical protein
VKNKIIKATGKKKLTSFAFLFCSYFVLDCFLSCFGALRVSNKGEKKTRARAIKKSIGAHHSQKNVAPPPSAPPPPLSVLLLRFWWFRNKGVQKRNKIKSRNFFRSRQTPKKIVTYLRHFSPVT